MRIRIRNTACEDREIYLTSAISLLSEVVGTRNSSSLLMFSLDLS
jgi:hypothetical protein